MLIVPIIISKYYAISVLQQFFFDVGCLTNLSTVIVFKCLTLYVSQISVIEIYNYSVLVGFICLVDSAVEILYFYIYLFYRKIQEFVENL